MNIYVHKRDRTGRMHILDELNGFDTTICGEPKTNFVSAVVINEPCQHCYTEAPLTPTPEPEVQPLPAVKMMRPRRKRPTANQVA